MAKRRYFAVILSIIMAFMGICAFEAIAPQTAMVAYAASLSAPKPTATVSSATSVKLKWKKVNGAKKYVIYRSTKKSSGYKAITTIKKPSTVTYTNKKLTCGETYYYKVEAVNGSKKSTSKPVKVKVLPPKPAAVTAESKNCGENTISYKASSGASGYQIYFAPKKDGEYTLLATTSKTSYVHKIGTGKTGFYKVKAYKKTGKKKVAGSFTEIVSAKALSHSYGSYVVDVSATCATEGSKHTTCEICKAKKTAVIDATGEHAYKNTVVAPTCTKRGYTTHTCKYCSKSFTDSYKNATGHTYTEKLTAPTCTTEGYSTFVCTVCKSSYTDNFVSPTGHSINCRVGVNPSCVAEGRMDYFCESCDLAYSEPIAKTTHNYGRTELVKEPTCNEPGEARIYCLNDGCEEYISNPIDKTEHNKIYESDGNSSHRQICSECGQVFLNENNEEYTNCNLIYTTSIKDGIQYFSFHCTDCGFASEEEFELAEVTDCPHENVEESCEASEPTCTTGGYTGYTICLDCTMIIDDGQAIDKLGHSFEIVETEIAASCSENGHSAIERCTRCSLERGGIVTADYLAKGHSYKESTVTASCVSDGYTVMKCENCGDELSETKSNITKTSGHSYNGYETNDKGYRIYTCSICGESDTDTVCYINLDTREISVKDVAEFVVSASGNDKLQLIYDGVSDYEITGSAENLIIDLDVGDVNSTKECDIKLAGVTITNDDLDILNIKNQTAAGSKVKVSVTAKVDTVNTLITKTSGNAIDSKCTLSLKGRGKLVMNTASTAISCSAKLAVKNLTLDITSANRGIDLEVTSADGSSSDYFNFELSGNAVITIKSSNDGIRCKNFDANYLAADEIDSIVTITSTDGDGIDAKGDSLNRRSVILHSGEFEITAGKKQVNVDNKKNGEIFNNTPIVDATAKVNFEHE